MKFETLVYIGGAMLVSILLILLILLWKFLGKKSEKTRFLEEKNAEISQKILHLEQERNHLIQENIRFEQSLSHAQKEVKNLELEKEYSEKEREKSITEKIEKLEHARENLENEKQRIIQKDEEKLEQEKAEISRIWNEHEQLVLSKLQSSCARPECRFVLHENTNLPVEFDGTIKPDAMVSFLGQYVVFDAKKSKNPQAYIDAQVKATAQKYKGNEHLYSTVFFVLPASEISQLSRKFYYEAGFSFVVIAPEGILPTLLLLKKITEYDKISEFSPQDREKIVHLLAQYERHIAYQNAANFVLSKKSLDLLETQKNLPENFQEDIQIRKNTISDIRMNPSEIKKYIKNPQLFFAEISEILTPAEKVDSKILEEVKSLFPENSTFQKNEELS